MSNLAISFRDAALEAVAVFLHGTGLCLPADALDLARRQLQEEAARPADCSKFFGDLRALVAVLKGISAALEAAPAPESKVEPKPRSACAASTSGFGAGLDLETGSFPGLQEETRRPSLLEAPRPSLLEAQASLLPSAHYVLHRSTEHPEGLKNFDPEIPEQYRDDLDPGFRVQELPSLSAESGPGPSRKLSEEPPEALSEPRHPAEQPHTAACFCGSLGTGLGGGDDDELFSAAETPPALPSPVTPRSFSGIVKDAGTAMLAVLGVGVGAADPQALRADAAGNAVRRRTAAARLPVTGAPRPLGAGAALPHVSALSLADALADHRSTAAALSPQLLVDASADTRSPAFGDASFGGPPAAATSSAGAAFGATSAFAPAAVFGGTSTAAASSSVPTFGAPEPQAATGRTASASCTTSLSPGQLRQPPSGDAFYPAESEGTVYDAFSLRVIFQRGRTGFEASKDFPIKADGIVAARFRMLEHLGSASSSHAVKCLDLHTNRQVCMKIIRNDKDAFDQSLDEIKLLRFIKSNTEDVGSKCCLDLVDYFYFKEHLIIVTELLRENLYDFSRSNREHGQVPYFTLGRLQRLSRQVLTALEYIHGLSLIHADVKPENILFSSHSRCEVKLIDFGSSCFVGDYLTSYVQSRSYRAPEVILGLHYDQKIDIWSLGCVVAELWTGYMLFQNDSIQSLLARMVSIVGPFPEHMLASGEQVARYFTKDGQLYRTESTATETQATFAAQPAPTASRTCLLLPKRSSIRQRMRSDDEGFIDFLSSLLQLDPAERASSSSALQHPWLQRGLYPDGL